MTLVSQIEPLLPDWLRKQRWMSKSEEALASVCAIDSELIVDASPMLLWMLIEAGDGARYQCVFGLRDQDSAKALLDDHPNAGVGPVEQNGDVLVAYDATIDDELCRKLLEVVSGGALHGTNVNVLGTEQSNTSIVFDNKTIMKVFRRMYSGVNPDIEVTNALADANYGHIAPVLAVWRRDGWDLGVCQPFLAGGTDGFVLAVASAKAALGAVAREANDVVGGLDGGPIGGPVDGPVDARINGDFALEAFRIGAMTGQLHVAMAKCFGTEPFRAASLIESLTSSAEGLDIELRPGIARIVDALSALDSDALGRAIRVHGDYHLGQTLWTEKGWYMFDFEGEPARPIDERVHATSPYKDVSGMARSFHYAAASGMFALSKSRAEDSRVEDLEGETSHHGQLASIALEWDAQSRAGFYDGYASVDGVAELLPTSESNREVLRTAFEVEKAIYELAYEVAYRPAWVAIPRTALQRLLLAD